MLGIWRECTPTKTQHRFLNCGKSQLKNFDTPLTLYLLCKVALNSLSSFGCQNEELGSIYPKIGRICQRFSGVIDRKSSVFRQQWLTSASTTQHAKILMPLQNMSKKLKESKFWQLVMAACLDRTKSSFIQKIQNMDLLCDILKMSIWPVKCERHWSRDW